MKIREENILDALIAEANSGYSAGNLRRVMCVVEGVGLQEEK